MKKLNLKLGGIKEMLSREQMKKVVGGDGYGYNNTGSSTITCTAIVYSGGSSYSSTGACTGGYTLEQCNQHGTNYCQSQVNAGASSCSSSCS
jgi:hypothetical protein